MSSPIHDPISPSRFLVDEHETASSPFPLTGSLQGRQYVGVHPGSVHGEEMALSLSGEARKAASMWSAVVRDAHGDEEDEIPSPFEEGIKRSASRSSLFGGKEGALSSERIYSTSEEMADPEEERMGKRKRSESQADAGSSSSKTAEEDREESISVEEEGDESDDSEEYIEKTASSRNPWTEREKKIFGRTSASTSLQFMRERKADKKIGDRYRRWTRKEVERVKELYESGKTYREIGGILDRPHKSVSMRLQRERRKEGKMEYRQRFWTSEETERLKELYDSGKTYREIGRILDRPRDAVSMRLYRERRKEGKMAYKKQPFPLVEEVTLREGEQAEKRRRVEHVPVRVEQEASDDNGLEEYLSVNKAVRSGKKKKHKDWTEVEDQILKNGCRMGLTHSVIASQLQGRSRCSVTGRIRTLEESGRCLMKEREPLRRNQKCWKQKEIKRAQQLLQEGKKIEEVADILKRSLHSVLARLRRERKKLSGSKRSREEG